MKVFALAFLLAIAGFSSVAQAYWQRSHWAKCSEAPTEAERVRLNCYIFAPAYDWPLEAGPLVGAYRYGAARPLVRK